jgi:uncharacterized repeat protein (TIGR01451 family)
MGVVLAPMLPHPHPNPPLDGEGGFTCVEHEVIQFHQKEKTMKNFPSSGGLFRPILGAVAAALIAFGSTGTAHANSAQNAKIINSITVNYNDATGAGPTFTKTAYTTVTVQLVQSALNVSTLADQTIDAGATASYQDYALSSTANGTDGYKVTLTLSAALNLSSETVNYSIYRYNGTTLAAAETGAAIVTATGSTTLSPVNIGGSVVTAWNGSDTLSVPAGSLNGIGTNTLVMVGAKGPFLVTATTPGTVPTTSPTEEVAATITLGQYAGGALPNTIVAGDIGSVVTERVFLRVTVAGAIATTATSAPDASITHTIVTTDSSDGHASTGVANVTTIRGTSLTISKNVANCTATGAACGASTATAIGVPGDILEYTITVQNSGSGPASKVSVADAVPNYTTLVVFTGIGGVSADSDVFARVEDGSTTVDTQVAGSGTADVAFGKVTFVTDRSAAGNPITFNLGTGSSTATGGTLVSAGPLYTIKYRVKVN